MTLNSRVKELYAHPIGRDIINKLLLTAGKPQWLVANPIIGNLRLRTVKWLAAVAKLNMKDTAFFDAFLDLLNSEPDTPRTDKIAPTQKWWKEAVFYQIYPRSFAEGLQGIISKLDYLKALGVDAVWLSPIYDSPEDDNGYDIRDYYGINRRFGTMRDMDELIFELHKRGMKIIMDLVINHTSDEHQWFRAALADEDSPYRDYYFFRKNETDRPPNNWASYFGGAAWRRFDNDWALHLFSKKQFDLNWENLAMRQELYKMVRWWLQKGVDGFRLDVINFISKSDGLPDGNAFVGEMMGYTGIEHYYYGPRLHKYLKELRREAFEPYDAATVGETPGIGLMAGRLLTDEYRAELDLIFSFDHLENPGFSRFDDYKYDLEHLKNFYISHLNADLGHGWATLFFNNHDNPRMVSKIDPTGEFRLELAKMLAVFQMTLRGTPFIYQGEELGAVNGKFASMDDLQDVESHGKYADYLAAGLTAEEAFAKILAGTRDHARIPMDWQEAARQEAEPDSVYNFYRRLAELRRKSQALRYGELEFLHAKERGYFGYTRQSVSEGYYIEANLTANTRPSYAKTDFELVMGNYGAPMDLLRAYEVKIFKI